MAYASNQPERILVVEDDTSMMPLLQKAILDVRPQAEIFTAISLEEAFTILIKNSDIAQKKPYSLIVADIFLEGSGTGLDLWRVLCATYPLIPFLVISSLPEEKVLEAVGEEEKKNLLFLKKPFNITDFKLKIKSILSRGPVVQTGKQISNLMDKVDTTLLSSEDKHKHMANLIILKLSTDWLERQEWMDSPYGGQNPVQDILFQTRLSTDRLWEDFFFKNKDAMNLDKDKIREHIMQISELTPELRVFFEERLAAMENMFRHEPKPGGPEAEQNN